MSPRNLTLACFLLPIQTTRVLSEFILGPDIVANFCNVCTHDFYKWFFTSIPKESCIICELGQEYSLFISLYSSNIWVIAYQIRQNLCTNEIQIRRTWISLPHSAIKVEPIYVGPIYGDTGINLYVYIKCLYPFLLVWAKVKDVKTFFNKGPRNTVKVNHQQFLLLPSANNHQQHTWKIQTEKRFKIIS